MIIRLFGQIKDKPIKKSVSQLDVGRESFKRKPLSYNDTGKFHKKGRFHEL